MGFFHLLFCFVLFSGIFFLLGFFCLVVVVVVFWVGLGFFVGCFFSLVLGGGWGWFFCLDLVWCGLVFWVGFFFSFRKVFGVFLTQVAALTFKPILVHFSSNVFQRSISKVLPKSI